jgi:hypothetical protein
MSETTQNENKTATRKRRPKPKTGAAAKTDGTSAKTNGTAKPNGAAAKPKDDTKSNGAASSGEKGASEPKEKKVASRKPKIPPQPASVVKSVISNNELLKGICELEPLRTITESSVSLTSAEGSLKADPVALEASFRLLEGLGLGKFVIGRRGTETRFIWFVGNIEAILQGETEEYARPEKLSTGVSRGLSASVKVSLTVEQRAALAEELGKENITQADLKKWGEEMLSAAAQMILDKDEEDK